MQILSKRRQHESRACAVLARSIGGLSRFVPEVGRPAHLSSSGGPRYIVVDEAIWKHARPDLGDLRLYADRKPK